MPAAIGCGQDDCGAPLASPLANFSLSLVPTPIWIPDFELAEFLTALKLDAKTIRKKNYWTPMGLATVLLCPQETALFGQSLTQGWR